MKNKKTTEEKIENLKLIKNLNIFESSFGITTALGVGYISMNDELSNFVLLPTVLLCGVLFYHGLSSHEKTKKKIYELVEKKMLKDLEN